MLPNTTIRPSLVTAALLAIFAAVPARADNAPLDLAALRNCAQQVQQLRSEATRLTANTAQLEARRTALDRRSAALQAEAAHLDRDNLHATLGLQQRRKQHNDELLAFNAEIAGHRQSIAAVNEVKRRYAQNCADRPYRRTDFQALSADAQAAMRAGLDDVEVPYLDPAASP